MNVVVVESPAKAKTINKYLGSDYIVLASFGHVRDLPPKNGSVDPENDFAMTWEVNDKAKKHMAEIAKAMKGADHLYLATDPDREGEAISWHIVELLRETNKLKDIPVSRVVFHEITKGAILEAMANPRDLNRELIDAYLARRALDYLVGFTLSPVLWRKLPGSRSAGRVQSVALRLICERESEIEIFKPQEFWSVKGNFTNEGGSPLSTRLTHLHGEKLDKFALGNEGAAQNAVTTAQNGTYKVTSVERKTVRRNPQPPFTTSTLQQEASRKLGFAAKRTMSTAQRLYEGIALNGETVGLISYMRTDSVTLSGEALAGSRRVIEKEYGGDYLPPSPRVFKSKAKNAQEAHEAIRPTDLSRLPANIGTYLDDDQRRLYELIWKRTLASQMQNATLEQVAVDLSTPDDAARFRANGSIIVFDGFLRLYQESKDDAKEGDDKERILPPMSEGEKVNLVDVIPDQHFTQPPPRYTEASLVGTLEELGIGRPSTYASIIDVLQARNYVRLDKRRFEPEDRGRLVTAFLENFFNTYVQYNFTADLEDQLDGISEGRIDWKKVLGDFWSSFIGAVDETKDLTIRQVIDVLDAELGPHFFSRAENAPDPRVCPSCTDGRLGLKLSKYGAFIGCANYPECNYTRPLIVGGENGDGGADAAFAPRSLGSDPETGEEVSVRKGPYGFYMQLGEAAKGKKPKRVSLPASDKEDSPKPDTIDLETALKFLGLPREIGEHPESGKMIAAGIGRFGPYVRHDGKYKSLEPDDDILSIGINRAVVLIAQVKSGGAGSGREIGKHPDDDKKIVVRSGRYGPYVSCGKLNASLPKDANPDEYTLEEALELLAAKAEKMGAKKPAKKKAATKKKAAAKKPAAKKPTAKKADADSSAA